MNKDRRPGVPPKLEEAQSKVAIAAEYNQQADVFDASGDYSARNDFLQAAAQKLKEAAEIATKALGLNN